MRTSIIRRVSERFSQLSRNLIAGRSPLERSIIAVMFIALATTGGICPTKSSPTDPGTVHESKIAVSLVGKLTLSANAYVSGELIGTVERGSTVVSGPLAPGLHSVQVIPNDYPGAWNVRTVDLKENTTNTQTFTADPAKIRVNLDALCLGDITDGKVYMNGTFMGAITPGGTLVKEVDPGLYTIELRDGSRVVSSQIQDAEFQGNYTNNFNCN